MAPSVDYKSLSDDALRTYVAELGLDSVGPRPTLLERIARHLKTGNAAPNGSGKGLINGNGAADGKGGKKKRRKKKKGGVEKGRGGDEKDKDSGGSGKVNGEVNGNSENGEEPLDVEIEYVTATPEIQDSAYEEFASVFAKFSMEHPDDDEEKEESAEAKEEQAAAEGEEQAEKPEAGGGASDNESETGDNATSRKKMRKLHRLTVAELKQLVKKPEVVDVSTPARLLSDFNGAIFVLIIAALNKKKWVDVTAADPKLLVSLKSYRNTVPVPVHWSQKRKYLQGKRGIEKPPFELPDFIKQTGIMELRMAVKEKEEAQKLKSKTRDRHQPKMGKLDIDYQKLHDAFFRWQSKPKLSIHGDLYYEGKEFETKLKARKPGQLSEELKMALNIPPLAPPPWLINMQRYGPPPSYPQLKIAGLNAPIPEGAQWGYHPGGWGKPPVDEYNRPLYGDVFGSLQVDVPSE
ncbi:hypothetical protein HK104_001975, partial [Borealophlyctis nickersoniae]